MTVFVTAAKILNIHVFRWEPRCGENEMFYRTCVPCTQSCANPNDVCLLMCTYNTCGCKPGFNYRDSKGKCTNDCSSDDANHFLLLCLVYLVFTLIQAFSHPYCKHRSCKEFACDCKPGYILKNSAPYSKCVPISSCGFVLAHIFHCTFQCFQKISF
ncbi:hypothetical protein ANCDUO_03384 [Ancylostoma duodenale]|uniref:Trypsin Inhibitor like cysteine rich domain protein n=1 Tax=Ancylostoma duodenale TaxID=51022 RepID=A0A0C2DU05_9BILA|nr:hypothetical protein ANCDUO_03384 [Ancylostoma duodenale]